MPWFLPLLSLLASPPKPISVSVDLDQQTISQMPHPGLASRIWHPGVIGHLPDLLTIPDWLIGVYNLCSRSPQFPAVACFEVFFLIMICMKSAADDESLIPRAHDTRSLSTPWALCNGASIEQTQKAAFWSNPNYFHLMLPQICRSPLRRRVVPFDTAVFGVCAIQCFQENR